MAKSYKLPDYAKRATWAHQNSFEVFALFTAAVLMVYAAGKASDLTTNLVILFLAARFAYNFFYIINVPILRSLMWATNMFCIASLMFTSFSGFGG